MAKLYDFGIGIYRTHVTWDEIEKKCQNVFGEAARFGSSKAISCIGDGRGFLSKMCLIEPDFPQGLEAPKKFILKICTQIAMIEATEKMKDKGVDSSPFSDPKMLEIMSHSIKKVHNVECTIYEYLSKNERTKLKFPKVYYSQKFTEENSNRGYLIMEFIEGAININMYDNIKADDLKQALRGIAAFEAIGLSLTEEDLVNFSINPWTELFGPLFAPDSVKAMIQMFRAFGEPELKEKIDKFEEYLQEIVDVPSYMKIADDLKIPPILVHGDLWSTNILWKQVAHDSVELAAIVDYQTTHLGLPAEDLVRIMGACLSGKERQERWEELAETFYSYLIEELKGAPAPYTLEQLKEAMRRFIPLGGFLLVPMIGPIFEMNNMNTDEEMKAKTKTAILEKSEALLDDIFAGVEYNRKIKSSVETK